MKVEPRKFNGKILKVEKITETNNNNKPEIKNARTIGTKIGAMVICKIISGMTNENISDTDKIIKIRNYCDKFIKERGKDLK